MIGLAMLCIVSAGFLFAVHGARQAVKDEALSTVRLALQLVEAGLPDQAGDGAPVSAWMNRLGRLDKIRHLRITIVGPHAATMNLSAPVTSHESPVPDWFRWAVAPAPIRVEHQLQDSGQQAYRILIEANADDEIQEVWSETRGFLLLLLALAGAVYGLVHVIVGRGFEPVAIIHAALEDVEHGEFAKRLPAFSLPEFDRLAQGYNHMASTLGAARKENQALIRHSLAIQEEERRSLARELHDEFGQCLTAIKMMSATLRQPGDDTHSAANQIMELCDRLFRNARSMMRRLRPMPLEDLGLSASLQDLIEQWQSGNPGLQLHLSIDPAADHLGNDLSLQIYRIVQEGITNMVRHAQARNGWIHMTTEIGGPAELTIRDDGRGLDSTRAGGGFGLLGMRERVASLGGQFSLECQSGQGLTLRITLPLTAA
jgi:two-component system sensor histidine kinase UhpB